MKKPTFSPSSGVFDAREVNVEIAAPNNAEGLFYTTDDSEPKLVNYSQVRVKVFCPAELKAVAFTMREGKAVFSDVATATYVWTQTATIVSCSSQSNHTWNIHYAYRANDGTTRNAIVVVGQDCPGWISPDESIVVPTPSGVNGIVKMECPALVKWGRFGVGNQSPQGSGISSKFLAAQ